MAFQQLLALEDIELIRYLMADELPSDQGLLRVVAQLRIDDVIN
jgi:succinate dehydrogenase flavin-adding protein (antitoxin of CptAB toxin-antitoxin module)